MPSLRRRLTEIEARWPTRPAAIGIALQHFIRCGELPKDRELRQLVENAADRVGDDARLWVCEIVTSAGTVPLAEVAARAAATGPPAWFREKWGLA